MNLFVAHLDLVPIVSCPDQVRSGYEIETSPVTIMDRTQELSDVTVSTSSLTEKLLTDQDLLSYHSMESQDTAARFRHAHTTASLSISIDTEDSSGEPFLRIQVSKLGLLSLERPM